MEQNEKLNVTTTFEFETKVKVYNKEKNQLIDAIVASTKMTKADSGRHGAIQEDWIDVTIDPSERIGEQPKIAIQSHTKCTKADAGRC
ncbi:MAG: hypothetical protein H7101_11615 [Deinococcales bacterium]|nr:hypothetical protein [Chitinophagaceae bacterium]